MISGKKSQYIVEELSEIIGMNINFMNEEGVIVASTDRSRIGTVHQGALVVLGTKKKLLVDKDNQYEGTKAGINLPVYFENRVIGVIGITGNDPEVLKMAEVIRKMTEILIKEQMVDERNEIVNQSKEVLIRDWMEGRWKDDKAFSSRAWLLGINVNLSRVVVTIRIHVEDNDQQEPVGFDLQREENRYAGYLREAIQFNDQDLIVPTGYMKYALLVTCPESGEEKRRQFVTRKIQYILRQIPKSSISAVKVGIGGYYDFIRGISVSYLESEKAETYSKTNKETDIVFYEDLRLELLLDGIPNERCSHFVQKTLNLKAFSDPEEIVETLTLFFANNQSINKTAEKLFIHKNTLQYRLIKIKEATGYDPRVFEEAVLLYLSLYLKSAHEQTDSRYT
jgi:carbohydrate diacid regulator